MLTNAGKHFQLREISKAFKCMASDQMRLRECPSQVVRLVIQQKKWVTIQEYHSLSKPSSPCSIKIFQARREWCRQCVWLLSYFMNLLYVRRLKSEMILITNTACYGHLSKRWEDQRLSKTRGAIFCRRASLRIVGLLISRFKSITYMKLRGYSFERGVHATMQYERRELTDDLGVWGPTWRNHGNGGWNSSGSSGCSVQVSSYCHPRSEDWFPWQRKLAKHFIFQLCASKPRITFVGTPAQLVNHSTISNSSKVLCWFA